MTKLSKPVYMGSHLAAQTEDGMLTSALYIFDEKRGCSIQDTLGVKELTNENLENIKKEGIYYSEPDNTCIGLPSDLSNGSEFWLRVIEKPYRQILVSGNNIYFKVSSWKKLLTAGEIDQEYIKNTLTGALAEVAFSGKVEDLTDNKGKDWDSILESVISAALNAVDGEIGECKESIETLSSQVGNCYEEVENLGYNLSNNYYSKTEVDELNTEVQISVELNSLEEEDIDAIIEEVWNEESEDSLE